VRLGLGGAGAFPSASRASVLWIGLDDGYDALASLAGVVERATEPLGFAPDLRPFHPHLTIARSSRAHALGSLVAALGDGPVGPAWDACEVVLMESDTRPTGAVYREISQFPLRR
jgi:RNA 2',3'-cyclic 3'-phosphodiesterase